MKNQSLFRRLLYTILFTSSFFWTITHSYSQNIVSEKKKVYFFSIEEDIMPATWRLVNKAVTEAEQLQVDLICIQMNTYGGMLDAADSISEKLLSTSIPVIVFIKNNAASAGAYIALSCDSIYMTAAATLGAASVVDESGALVADKYQSYMRSQMKSVAFNNNRDTAMAVAMVGCIKTIPNVIDSGRVLTLTTHEALKYGFCEAQVSTKEDAIAHAGIQDYEFIEYHTTTADRIIGFFMNPIVHGLCLTLIILGLYFELQSPGIGFPLLVSVIAALSYFAPLYIDGLAANWEILLFVIGLILIVLEIFVIPGFGVTGIAGIVLIFGGAVLSMIGNIGFNFSPVQTGGISTALSVVLSSFLISFIVIIIFFNRIMKSPAFKKITLETEMRSSQNYHTNVFSDREDLLHQIAIAETDLRPSGKISIDGDYFEAQTNGEYILKGKTVKIISIKNMYLIVREVI